MRSAELKQLGNELDVALEEYRAAELAYATARNAAYAHHAVGCSAETGMWSADANNLARQETRELGDRLDEAARRLTAAEDAYVARSELERSR